jgi:hypothetical protein
MRAHRSGGGGGGGGGAQVAVGSVRGFGRDRSRSEASITAGRAQLAALVRACLGVPGLARLRLSSLDPAAVGAVPDYGRPHP